MGKAHLRRHASLWLARNRESTRSQIKDLLSASGLQPSLESHFPCVGVPVFLFVNFSFLSNQKIIKPKKNPHAGFSLSIFQERVRFCVGDQPEQSTRTQGKCDSRLFAEACKPKACVPPQTGFTRLGLFVVSFSQVSTQIRYTKSKYIP